jgi:hypothetical protein
MTPIAFYDSFSCSDKSSLRLISFDDWGYSDIFYIFLCDNDYYVIYFYEGEYMFFKSYVYFQGFHSEPVTSSDIVSASFQRKLPQAFNLSTSQYYHSDGRGYNIKFRPFYLCCDLDFSSILEKI